MVRFGPARGFDRIAFRGPLFEGCAAGSDRAERAHGRPRGANHRPQFHHRLVEITRPAGIKKSCGHTLDPPPARPPGLLRHRRQPRDHPHHIAVDHHLGAAEGDAQYRRRRIDPDARQPQHDIPLLRKAPTIPGHDLPRRPVQIARPCIIAHALPSLEHRIQGCGRQARDVGKAGEKTLIIGQHLADLGLL